MRTDVAKVAKQRYPAFMSALAILFRWPDLTLGLRFVTGCVLLGQVESPALFREPGAGSGAGSQANI